jgi:hypothetical protein
LPLRVTAPDCMVCGVSLAHDTRWPGVGNRLISRPIVRHEVANRE